MTATLHHTTPPGVHRPVLVGGRGPEIGVQGLVERLAAVLADRQRLAALDTAGVKARIAALRRLSGLAETGLAAAMTALEAAGGLGDDGAPSKADWLKAHDGRSGREAARVARLADALEDLPDTAQALSDGKLSAETADAIVKASRDGRLGTPEQVEQELLPVATRTTPERLRRHIKSREHAADGSRLARDERRQRALRRLSLHRSDTGMWDIHGQLADEAGTRLRTALDAFDIPTEGTRGRPDKRMADALDALATAALDHAMTPGNGGTARPHLSVIVPAETLDADLTDPAAADPDAPDAAAHPHGPAWDGLAPGTTAWGGTLSPQAIRRLTCDAALTRVVMAGESQVLDVGRATRNWSGPQRTAINARDLKCRGPSCDRPIGWTNIHHLTWWRNGGTTSVDNGLALCHHCHHLIHDGNWTVELDPTTAVVTWTSPSGTVTTTQPDVGSEVGSVHRSRRRR